MLQLLKVLRSPQLLRRLLRLSRFEASTDKGAMGLPGQCICSHRLT